MIITCMGGPKSELTNVNWKKEKNQNVIVNTEPLDNLLYYGMKKAYILRLSVTL